MELFTILISWYQIFSGFEESPVSTHIQKDSTVGLGCALPSSPYTASIQWYKDDQATELPQNAVSSFLQVGTVWLGFLSLCSKTTVIWFSKQVSGRTFFRPLHIFGRIYTIRVSLNSITPLISLQETPCCRSLKVDPTSVLRLTLHKKTLLAVKPLAMSLLSPCLVS